MRQKVWKNSEKVWKVRKKDQKKFGKSSEKVRKFRNLGISELSENYEKMTFNSKFENHKKLVPTRKPTRKFGKKFRMQGLKKHVTSFNAMFVLILKIQIAKHVGTPECVCV